MKLIVSGAAGLDQVPGLDAIAGNLEIVFAPDSDSLKHNLPGAEILLGWNFRGNALRQHWTLASELKWIHWCGAGVDGILFPELVSSSVVLTNARGIFDRAIAEYVLLLLLAQAKRLHETTQYQRRKQWNHRISTRLDGTRATVFGMGSIGREIARLLEALGVQVVGIGRTARKTGSTARTIKGVDDAIDVLPDSDWVISALPHTRETDGLFDARMFRAMKQSAYFVNVGRGSAVDEAALRMALQHHWIAGAALDVYRNEPLPDSSELWDTPNLLVSPHMSGDYAGYQDELANQFLANVAHYQAGQTLENIVDKSAGYIPTG